ncbi:Beta/gamma crystallin [Metarhizium guizhouense ARSEF 977]|uniref:Beta/gamma crystallin n=1 Tax=Metarhizium guizhouense (strain ARSEF 977) TaxID=1276136 RepID=A0A0B4GYB3_METGA|nr:Beta/gamma crystallin [Metarhizium guizhouense ARSEF 977]
MHLSTLAVVVSLSAVLAALADSPDAALRDPSVYFCKHVDFEPPCIYMAAPTGRCVNLPSAWNDEVSSLRPDPQIESCRFFQHYNCQGPSFDASYPGYSNLINDVPGFNDQISSFMCDY